MYISAICTSQTYTRLFHKPLNHPIEQMIDQVSHIRTTLHCASEFTDPPYPPHRLIHFSHINLIQSKHLYSADYNTLFINTTPSEDHHFTQFHYHVNFSTNSINMLIHPFFVADFLLGFFFPPNLIAISASHPTPLPNTPFQSFQFSNSFSRSLSFPHSSSQPPYFHINVSNHLFNTVLLLIIHHHIYFLTISPIRLLSSFILITLLFLHGLKSFRG